MSRADDIKELIQIHNVRLHELEKTKARLGYNADPAISVEIKEIKEKRAELLSELKDLENKKCPPSPKTQSEPQETKQTPRTRMTIQEAIDRYLKQIKRSKSPNTAVAYSQGLQAFGNCLLESDLAVEFTETDVASLSPQWLETFLDDLHKQSVATERLYTTAVAGFYRYVAAQEWAAINLSTLDFEMSQRRTQGKRLHIFPEKDIEKLLVFMEEAAETTLSQPPKKWTTKLAQLRDTALLITLADTGLRVSEACGLQRGHLDWERQRAIIIGKGDKQAIVRFSERSLKHITTYLKARFELDQIQGRQDVLPIFARHDKKSGKKVLPMSARTAENIVADRVVEALGEESLGTITPHTFRHYFVTRAARHQDILLAQHLARHESITTTSGYTHLTDNEIDAAYKAVFDRQAEPTTEEASQETSPDPG